MHSRLNNMIGVTLCDSEIKVRNIELCGDEECKPGNLFFLMVMLCTALGSGD